MGPSEKHNFGNENAKVRAKTAKADKGVSDEDTSRRHEPFVAESLHLQSKGCFSEGHMVIVEYSSYFVKSFQAMPRIIQEKAAELEEIFKKDPSDPRLRQKRLKGRLKGLQSLRITRNYRILFAWKTKNTALFYEISDRKYIYR